jgi:hypothetical protein
LAPCSASSTRCWPDSTRHASEINGQHAWATGLFDLLNFLDFASDYSDPFANDFRQQDGELRKQLHASA